MRQSPTNIKETEDMEAKDDGKDGPMACLVCAGVIRLAQLFGIFY